RLHQRHASTLQLLQMHAENNQILDPDPPAAPAFLYFRRFSGKHVETELLQAAFQIAFIIGVERSLYSSAAVVDRPIGIGCHVYIRSVRSMELISSFKLVSPISTRRIPSCCMVTKPLASAYSIIALRVALVAISSSRPRSMRRISSAAV